MADSIEHSHDILDSREYASRYAAADRRILDRERKGKPEEDENNESTYKRGRN
jgi:hypothetical protein